MIFASMAIIAANAGGAWSPMGGVWRQQCFGSVKRVTTGQMIKLLFVFSLISLLVPSIYLSNFAKRGEVAIISKSEKGENVSGSKVVFCLGVVALIFVPILRALTSLPPYMGIMLV